jgi:hypothetical protein
MAGAVLTALLSGGALAIERSTDSSPRAASAPVEQPSLSQTTFPVQEIRGWPHTAQNPAGEYSWDRHTCAGQYCVLGFMHNGYGSGEVAIHVQGASEAPVPKEGRTAVTFAGHDGLYRRIGARTEEWIVPIQEVTLAVRLEAKQGATQADMAEAHAIIESMRTEPRDTNLGFRLVFTLATDDWDSG